MFSALARPVCVHVIRKRIAPREIATVYFAVVLVQKTAVFTETLLRIAETSLVARRMHDHLDLGVRQRTRHTHGTFFKAELAGNVEIRQLVGTGAIGTDEPLECRTPAEETEVPQVLHATLGKLGHFRLRRDLRVRPRRFIFLTMDASYEDRPPPSSNYYRCCAAHQHHMTTDPYLPAEFDGLLHPLVEGLRAKSLEYVQMFYVFQGDIEFWKQVPNAHQFVHIVILHSSPGGRSHLTAVPNATEAVVAANIIVELRLLFAHATHHFRFERQIRSLLRPRRTSRRES